MKKALFIDRDGTIIVEPPVTEQVDTLEQLEFLQAAIGSLANIAELDYELVIASNQDGLGTESNPEDRFYMIHNKMLDTLKGEGVIFDDQLIDPHYASDNHPNRKPGTGMFGKYMSGEYDLAVSVFILFLTDTQEIIVKISYYRAKHRVVMRACNIPIFGECGFTVFLPSAKSMRLIRCHNLDCNVCRAKLK